MVVYRTPGGGAGEEARRLLPAADRQPQTETPSDTNASTMLGPDRMYRRKSPAAEPPRHPGRAGLLVECSVELLHPLLGI